jgi:transcriptional regulator with GAF, ATPase, and Fis domain
MCFAVWAEFDTGGGPEGERRNAEILRRLAGRRIEVRPREDGSEAPCPAWPGLLVCTRPDGRMAARIAELRRLGADRLVVLAAGDRGEPFAPGLAWELLAAGASDVFAWRGGAAAEDLAARLERWAEIDRLVDADLVRRHLVGRSPAWLAALRQVVELARFSDAALLLAGETGCGKELFARLVHTLDGREGKRDLIVLDCATLSSELAGSEFFGHERGSFTSAVAAREGAFALADRGTLFLDEVGELPPRLQAELLRVLQEGQYKKIGSNSWQKTRFRLLSATHRPLAAALELGELREDFFHRLATFTCRLPPLRERREDIPLLVRHFLEQAGGEAPELDPDLLGWLCERDYPGNVRELRQLVLRLHCRHVGRGPLTPGDLPPAERPAGRRPPPCAPWEARLEAGVAAALEAGQGLRELTNVAADKAVELCLKAEGGNLTRAAKRLGVTDRALQLRRANARRGEP